MGEQKVMTEYECALSEAVRVLGMAVLEIGGNPKTIEAGLKEMQEDMKKDGRNNGAAVLQLLRDAWLEPPYRPLN
jgi:hypothetical protein